MSRARQVRRLLHRNIGVPVATCRVPARLPLVLDRYQVSFGSFSVPPLPAPVLLVHTAGKPLKFRAVGERRTRQSLPGLVSFIPAFVRSEAALHGVGEGTLVHFDVAGPLPAWLRRSPYTTPVTFTNDVIVALTRRLMHEPESGARHAVYLRSLGQALLAELQRELTRVDAAALPAATRGELRVARAATQHVLAHLGEPLRVADLAKASGVGLTSFAREFRQAMSVTPHRYLRRARIERACELLRTTGLSVLEVAEAVGFRGQSHFSTVFTAERGLTPSAYRRASRVTEAGGVRSRRRT